MSRLALFPLHSKSTCDFDSTLMGVFERFLGSGSLECFKAFIVHRQVAFLISSGGIRLIFLEIIALADAPPNFLMDSNVSLN